MKRREWIKTAAWTTAALGMPWLCRAGEPAQPPNIIFILADDLGYGDLGCYGSRFIRTPNLDKMANEGMRFTQHYSGSTVCAPSRCSLMTGRHTGHTFIRGNKEIQPEGQYPIPADTATIAKAMKQAGYTTGCIGKWGLGGPGSTGEPNRQGFDHWFGYLCQRQAHRFYPSHLWRNNEKIELDGTVYSQDLMAQEALEFIEANKDRPFFLYLPFTIPHAELKVPDDSLNEYKGKFEETPFAGAGNYGPQEYPRAAYCAMVSRLDRDIGRILTLLKKLEIDDNTLVMFASDNGPHREGGNDPEFFDSNGPLRGIKRDVYEGGIRTPLIARWPGRIRAGSVNHHISAFWDLFPTFTELGQAQTPPGLDGISMVPTLLGRDDEQQRHRFLYWEFHDAGGKKIKQAARMGEWKAVRNGFDQPLELYHLDHDIGETTNVAGRHPDIVKTIEEYLTAARVDSDVFPVES